MKTFKEYIVEAKKLTITSTLEYGDMPEVFEVADELDVTLKTVSPGIQLTGSKDNVAEMLAYFNRWTLKELVQKHPELKGSKISGEMYDLED